MQGGMSLVTVTFQSFLIRGKHFKCLANVYLMHLEKLDLNAKVSVLTFKFNILN